MRTTTTQQIQTISRLETKATELDRQLALAVAHERTAKATLRSSESKNRTLREDMGKLKVMVTQIRGQCANDIRKRDGEISRLKRHLEGRRGRDGAGGQAGVVVITPGASRNGKGSTMGHSEAVFESPDYSLKQETTSYLAELCQNLNNENNAFANLVGNTLSTLRDLQGLPPGPEDNPESTTNPHDQIREDPNVTLTLPPSYSTLAASTDEALQHLRELLTKPSFVPLAEVEIREDELVRLRQGWEKMEARWRDAVTLMASWRKRMMETGDTIDLEDLRKGMTLEADAPGESNGDANDVSDLDAPNAEDQSDSDTIIQPAENSTASPLPPARNTSTRIALSAGLFPIPTSNLAAPQTTNGNAPRSPSGSPRKVSFLSPSPSAAGNLASSPKSEPISEPETTPEPEVSDELSSIDFANLDLLEEPSVLEMEIGMRKGMAVGEKIEKAPQEAEGVWEGGDDTSARED